MSTEGQTQERRDSPAHKLGWDQSTIRELASTPTGLVAAVAGLNVDPRQSFGAILHSADGRTRDARLAAKSPLRTTHIDNAYLRAVHDAPNGRAPRQLPWSPIK